MTTEQLEKENRQLKARCATLSRGLLCHWCDMECESRQYNFDPDYIPEEVPDED